MATNEAASPPARAAGPKRCSEVAVPRTIGTIGNTHGERIESAPATNAKGSAPGFIGRSEGLAQQRGDRGTIGVADGAAGFLFALECDQRRLHAGAEIFHGVLLAVEIDHEID